MPQAAPPKGGGGLIGISGLPIASSVGSGAKADKEAGAEVELTAQNAAQVLQSPGALLLQVGTLSDTASKKLRRLRVAAAGRLPLVRLDCEALPQICQGLQIRSEPTVLLMAKGQVAAALENDLEPPAVTAFVEGVAKALGLKMDLAEDVAEQLTSAEELEWSDPVTAEEAFEGIMQAPDLSHDARIRAAAGRVRCAARQPGRGEEAQAYMQELEAAGHGRVPDVKQAAAMLKLLEYRPAEEANLEELEAASSAAPADAAAAQAYTAALFWRGDEGQAVDAALKLLRKSPRSDELRQVVLALIEALGPRHPRTASARRAFSNALFI